ncbi:MAG: hypothetical protein JXA42_04880 [Anaerolineales bacterium]|nr:hypothetical protein [Anaerolineales bacterium]
MILHWFTIILGWASIISFISLAGYRIYKYAAMPLNLRWEVYPVPHETKKVRRYGGSYMEQVDWAKKTHASSFSGELIEMASEIFTLKRVREHNPYGLWPWSITLHWGAYLAVLWVILLPASILIPGLTPMLSVVGFLSFALGIIGAMGLIVKRSTLPALKLYTAPADMFNLVFMAIFFGLGIASWIGDPLLAGHRAYAGSLITLRPAPVSPLVLFLFLVLQLFAIYMPASKLIHPLLKHFTFTKILWDDAFKVKGSKVDERIKRQLEYPVTWSGPHLKGAGTWIKGVQATSPVEEEK